MIYQGSRKKEREKGNCLNLKLKFATQHLSIENKIGNLPDLDGSSTTRRHTVIYGLIGKDSDAGRDGGQEEKGTTEDEMAGWHH